MLIFNSYGQDTVNFKNEQKVQVSDSVKENKVIYSFSAGMSFIHNYNSILPGN